VSDEGNSTAPSSGPPSEDGPRGHIPPLVAGITGWLVPGLGHLLLRRWGRAATFFVVVGGLAMIGYHVRGNLFPFQPGEFRSDPFSFLGSIADLGSGIFYFLGSHFEPLGPDVAHAAGDYGTRFIATAGVINFLCALDAFEIALRRKE
jgi:hypothetical protein